MAEHAAQTGLQKSGARRAGKVMYVTAQRVLAMFPARDV
jgi:hypothetical protein